MEGLKNMLIIYPHWPPSNLAGVHRARLISNFLPDLGWHPIVITVKPEFYEEKPDTDIERTVAQTTEVIKVDAKPLSKGNRFIGDLGLRAMKFLRQKALEVIQERKIDFLWIPIPSFYVAVLGRQIYNKTGVPYGIDYIDPWVNSFVGQDKVFSKAWLSNQLSKVLEPYAVKKAALISGVSTPYYQPVIDRNFKNRPIAHVGMPYGFDPSDHEVQLENIQAPWEKDGVKKPLIYAGAFLPGSHPFLKSLFASIKKQLDEGSWDKDVHCYFLGTGNYPGTTIEAYSKQYGIEAYVHEINQRFPFLHILNLLSAAYGVTVIGSTDEHYTASKIFQSLLSKKAVFSIFHHKSSAVQILKECQADQYLVHYDPEASATTFDESVDAVFRSFLKQEKGWAPQLEALKKYSAYTSAKRLVETIEPLIR